MKVGGAYLEDHQSAFTSYPITDRPTPTHTHNYCLYQQKMWSSSREISHWYICSSCSWVLIKKEVFLYVEDWQNFYINTKYSGILAMYLSPWEPCLESKSCSSIGLPSIVVTYSSWGCRRQLLESWVALHDYLCKLGQATPAGRCRSRQRPQQRCLRPWHVQRGQRGNRVLAAPTTTASPTGAASLRWRLR